MDVNAHLGQPLDCREYVGCVAAESVELGNDERIAIVQSFQ